jgi:hypothetical protein
MGRPVSQINKKAMVEMFLCIVILALVSALMKLTDKVKEATVTKQDVLINDLLSVREYVDTETYLLILEDHYSDSPLRVKLFMSDEIKRIERELKIRTLEQQN